MTRSKSMSRAIGKVTRRCRLFPAAIAVLLILCSVRGGARPQYGGTLRLELSSTLRTLDPAAGSVDAADAAARARLLPLMFETLVAADGEGRIVPRLAASWEHDARSIRWRFRLRRAIAMHDGSRLDAAQAAAVLRGQGPWNAAADGDAIVIDCEREAPDLLWELAAMRHAIVGRRGPNLVGTGPFRVDRLESGSLVLRAHEDYWKGRPFVDAVQVSMGRAPADQVASLETGRTDFIVVEPPDAARHSSSRGTRVAASLPVDLIALVFEEQRAAPSALPLRRALAAAIDRSALCSVVLQRRGQPAAGLLPDWLSGYASVMTVDAGHSRAKALVAAIPPAQRALALRVDSTSPIDRAVAERIAVDAREAGLTVRVDPADALSPRPDLRLVRAAVEPTSPDRALAAILSALGPRAARVLPADTTLPPAAPLEAVYRLERAILEPQIVVPVVHVPELVALAARVQIWNGRPISPAGAWDLADLWIGADRP